MHRLLQPGVWGVALVLAACWLPTGRLYADTPLDRLLPEGDVVAFRLPMFNREGYREWILTARRGRYVHSDRIEVNGMDLRAFSGDAADALNLTILSNRAIFAPQSNRASGPGVITLFGAEYQATGSEWNWEGETGVVTVRRNVRVIFNQPMMNLLR
ncbi:MAG: hypothetical protein ACFB20_00600 [Opitutales bacterium]